MVKTFLQQPLLWFFIVGAVLFAIDGTSASRDDIVVDRATTQQLQNLWQTQTGKAPSESELASLVNNWIKEEVLYREALRLDLDNDDSIIRRRLIQKISFIAETTVDASPDNAALETYYQQHIDQYTLPVRYSLRQLYFQTEDAARKALNRGAESAPAAGALSMLNQTYLYKSTLQLNATFGQHFGDQIEALDTQSWSGPIKSAYGFHLVYVTDVYPPEATPFATVQEQVLADYQQSQREAAQREYVDRLLTQYNIVREAP